MCQRMWEECHPLCIRQEAHRFPQGLQTQLEPGSLPKPSPCHQGNLESANLDRHPQAREALWESSLPQGEVSACPWSLDALEMVRGTLPVPSLPKGDTGGSTGSNLSHGGRENLECTVSPAVWDAAGETHFSLAAPRVLRQDVHLSREEKIKGH